MNRKTLFYLVLFCICFIADRLTKSLALLYLRGGDYTLNNFLTFSLQFNRGISWSLLSYNSTLGFAIITTIVFLIVCIFTIFVLHLYRSGSSVGFEVMVIAGAISNLVDRFLYVGVVDFISAHIGTWYWPTFNIADAFIVVGVVGIILKGFEIKC